MVKCNIISVPKNRRESSLYSRTGWILTDNLWGLLWWMSCFLFSFFPLCACVTVDEVLAVYRGREGIHFQFIRFGKWIFFIVNIFPPQGENKIKDCINYYKGPHTNNFHWFAKIPFPQPTSLLFTHFPLFPLHFISSASTTSLLFQPNSPFIYLPLRSPLDTHQAMSSGTYHSNDRARIGFQSGFVTAICSRPVDPLAPFSPKDVC